jgi:hypothetical protein
MGPQTLGSCLARTAMLRHGERGPFRGRQSERAQTGADKSDSRDAQLHRAALPVDSGGLPRRGSLTGRNEGAVDGTRPPRRRWSAKSALGGYQKPSPFGRIQGPWLSVSLDPWWVRTASGSWPGKGQVWSCLARGAFGGARARRSKRAAGSAPEGGLLCESHCTRGRRRRLRSAMDRSREPQGRSVVSAFTCSRCVS